MDEGTARSPRRGAGRAGSLLRYVLSLVIAGVCLWLALRGVDISSFGEVLAGANVWLICLAGVLSLAVSAVHCTKIRLLMANLCKLRYRTVFSAELVSILVDIVLPMRLQELVRAFIIGRGEGIRPSKVLGVQVVEKAVEMPLLLALLLSLGLSHPLPTWALSTVWMGLAGAAVVMLALVLAVARPRVMERPIAWLGEQKLPGASLASGAMSQVLAGMRLGTTRPMAVFTILLITLCEWAVLASSLWLSAASIEVYLGGWELVGLLTVNFVAFAVPSSSSGAVGIYEFTGKTMMMMLFGMEAEQALAVVMLAHATLIGFGIVGGLAGLVLAQVSIAEMRGGLRRTALEREGTEPPAGGG